MTEEELANWQNYARMVEEAHAYGNCPPVPPGMWEEVMTRRRMLDMECASYTTTREDYALGIRP